MADQTGLRGRVLRGARGIAPLIYPELFKDKKPKAIKKAIRKLYTEWRRYPIFQLGDNTELLALEDRLLSFLEAKSAAAELAAAEPKAAFPPLPKARRRRRARSPANEAA